MEKELSVYLQVTRTCNHRCVFCSYPPNEEYLPLSELKERIDKYYEDNITELSFTGGEPTLHSDLVELIKYAKEKGIYCRIITNGVRLKDNSFLNKLVSAGLDKVGVSFQSHIKEINEFLSARNTYKDIVQGLHNLNDRTDIDFNIHSTLNTKNYETFPEYIDFIHNNFNRIKFMSFNYLDCIGDAKINPWIMPKLSKVMPFILDGFKKLREYKIYFHAERIPLCFMPEFEAHSTETLQVLKQTYIMISRVVDSHKFNSIAPNWQRHKVLQCKGCSLNEMCVGLKDHYIDLFGTGEPIASKKTSKDVLQMYYDNIEYYGPLAK